MPVLQGYINNTGIACTVPILERQCDGGKGDMTPAHWAEKIALRLKGEPAGYFGCGTRFQWWWGSNCLCPTCGTVFVSGLAELKRYRLDSPTEQQDNQQDQED